MIVHVAKRKEPLVVLDGTAISDPRLSFRSKGLMAFLLTRPDGWKITVEALECESVDGRDAIRTSIAELETVGYIRKERHVEGDGQFEGWDYVICEVPITGIPNSEKLIGTKDALNINTNTREDNTNTSSSSKKKKITDGQEPSTPEPSVGRGKPTWISIYLDIWKSAYGGLLPLYKYLRLFRSLEKLYGRTAVVEAFVRYCNETPPEKADPFRFGSIIKVWMPKNTQDRPGVVDEGTRWR